MYCFIFIQLALSYGSVIGPCQESAICEGVLDISGGRADLF
ncbi:hypothetical protein [Pseudoalteromonas sp. H105]|jgi:hypothetical protein|nr:hypothetical protein [Pseudoalteromonas sp. H105]